MAIQTAGQVAKILGLLAALTPSSQPPPSLKPASAAFQKYIRTAKNCGIASDQIKNFLRAGVVLQQRQLEASAAARACDIEGGPTELGYGGARGGGKSHWLLAQIGADDCQRYPGLKCLILRKVGKSLKEGIRDLLSRTLRGIPYKYVPSQSTIYFPNGSMIILGHFQKESDIDSYLGLEYDIIGVEEATTLSFTKYEAVRTCCRTSKPGWRPRMYSTTNPGNIGHAWYKALFIDSARKAVRKAAETGMAVAPLDTLFVAATVDDNAFVNKEYKKQLEKLQGWQLAAWRYGDWDIAAGQYFTNFRPHQDGRPHHVLPTGSLELSPDWTYWCSLDYGFVHYTVVHLFAKDGDGNLYCLDEHAERRWVMKRHADAIKAMLARHRLSLSHLAQFVAGHDLFAKKGDGLTIAEQYESEGIFLERANIDRINGAGEILNRFGDTEGFLTNDLGVTVPDPILPTLFISERCHRLIECLPTLEHDPHRPEDVLKVDCDDNGVGGDDPYDCFRYGVMAAYNPQAYMSVPVATTLPPIGTPKVEPTAFDTTGRMVAPARTQNRRPSY